MLSSSRRETEGRDTVAERAHQFYAPEELALLDRIIHERVRLGIVSALALNDSLTFNELKEFLAVTEGNLSAHAQKLEAAGYVSYTKSFEGRIPCTKYRITEAGRRALVRHLAHLSAVIRWASQ